MPFLSTSKATPGGERRSRQRRLRLVVTDEAVPAVEILVEHKVLASASLALGWNQEKVRAPYLRGDRSETSLELVRLAGEQQSKGHSAAAAPEAPNELVVGLRSRENGTDEVTQVLRKGERSKRWPHRAPSLGERPPAVRRRCARPCLRSPSCRWPGTCGEPPRLRTRRRRHRVRATSRRSLRGSALRLRRSTPHHGRS